MAACAAVPRLALALEAITSFAVAIVSSTFDTSSRRAPARAIAARSGRDEIPMTMLRPSRFISPYGLSSADAKVLARVQLCSLPVRGFTAFGRDGSRSGYSGLLKNVPALTWSFFPFDHESR